MACHALAGPTLGSRAKRRPWAVGRRAGLALLAAAARHWTQHCSWVAPRVQRAPSAVVADRRLRLGGRQQAAAAVRPLPWCQRRRAARVALAAGGGKEDPAEQGGSEKRRGYQFGDLFLNKLTGKDKYEFGDLSRMIDGKIKEAACQFTGKDEYKFGDVSRHLDLKAKEEVKKFTGKDEYEFGDISRSLDTKAKDEVRKLTGKDQYEFGDISKEIARRVQAGEVDFEDLYLLLRAVLVLGAGLMPVAHLLPMQLLLNFLDWNLQIDVTRRLSDKVSGAVAAELDRRAKSAILGEGNENYVLGDLTKEQMQKAVKSITGKDTYEFGDISRAMLQKAKG